MATTIVNCLIAGVLGAIAIVIVNDVVGNAEPTEGWTGVLAAVMPMIPVVVGVVVIVGMFMLLTKLT